MTSNTILVNMLLAITLFFINGLIGKAKLNSGYSKKYSAFEFSNVTEKNFAGNFFHAVIHPSLFLAIVCVVLQYFSLGNIANELWLVVPAYWILRFLHTILWSRLSLICWRYEIPALITSIALGEFTLFAIIRPLIDNNKSILIDLEQFRDAFWFAAITYLAKLFWDVFKVKTTSSALYPAQKKKEIIKHRYNKFHEKYNSYIEEQLARYKFPDKNTKKHFICLFYSVMIYEDHSRPVFIRHLEYMLKLVLWKRIFSLGIMQVQSSKIIGDKKSIALALDILYKPFMQAKASEKIYNAIKEYNKGKKYYDEVNTIYRELITHQQLKKMNRQTVRVYKKQAIGAATIYHRTHLTK